MKVFSKLLLASVFVIAITGVAFGATWTLTNTNGGDGYVVIQPYGFDLYGADNGAPSNFTTYTFTAGTAETLVIPWVYHTYDCCSSYWDPAGYTLNGGYYQLTVDFLYTAQSGILTIGLNPGDIFGFYVYSPDSIEGRGEISAMTPEPATMTLLVTGVLGYMASRRRKV